MNQLEQLFTFVIFIGALFYIYKTLFKKSSCGGSCGCSAKKDKKGLL